ncbi:MAG: AsnC family protein [Candidatus Aminicenantes bacterium]|nr:MAG: AsnC family protein [Candidatus Aminicenantes bacterium]
MKTDKRITELVYENPSISVSELARITGLTRQVLPANLFANLLCSYNVSKAVSQVLEGRYV